MIDLYIIFSFIFLRQIAEITKFVVFRSSVLFTVTVLNKSTKERQSNETNIDRVNMKENDVCIV